MMLKEEINKIIIDQKKNIEAQETGIIREDLKETTITPNFVLIISGVRRCGKSVFLNQLKNKQEKCAYFNFEDTRLNNFNVDDFSKLEEQLTEIYNNPKTYFFDEIQNIKKWEIFIRQLQDKKKQIIITGSNASLLSKELGTRLTGRHLNKELFPFSFKEFKTLKKETIEKYLIAGGFPEYLKQENDQILQELLNNIIYRDIIVRHNIKDTKTIKDLTTYLLSNIGKEYSYNSLKKLFGVGSINTIINYISYLEDSYILFSINQFDYSYKKQIKQPKKIYAIDNGLITTNTVSLSKDLGRLLENLVFINLRKKYKNIYYYKKETNECDFIIKEKEKITTAIQVCYKLTPENKEREINGLLKALEFFKIDTGTIITYNQEEKIKINTKTIEVVPIEKFI
ncbi:MAG: ATP-binding protein [Candidatus ainarchaeum sp.]|nr:ATP-binding protein [Candidatus ainarchaeum sp.]